MIEQTEQFKSKRAKVRYYTKMRRVTPNNALYRKLMGQKYNKKYDGPLTDKEVEMLRFGLQKVIEVCERTLKDGTKRNLTLHFLKATRLVPDNQPLYRKIIADSVLTEEETNEFNEGLKKVIQSCKELKNELYQDKK